jgi:hypothetical protein
MKRGAGVPARVRVIALGLCLGLGLGSSCTRTIELGSDQIAQATGGSAGASDSGGAAGIACVVATCRGSTPYACGNCDDDDLDGKVDAEDPECTGPCDDREDSLSVGIDSENAANCQEDCYFDRGRGPGNDGCRFSHRCDRLSMAPDYPPTGEAACVYDEATKLPGGSETCEELRTTQPASCNEICGPLTPNGCDCFGCCELPAGSGSYVWLGSNSSGGERCSFETLGDPTICRACTPVPSCLNRCEPCETCVGRPAPLPSCDETSGEPCAAVHSPCNQPTVGGCGDGSYCVTGCCIPEPR